MSHPVYVVSTYLLESLLVALLGEVQVVVHVVVADGAVGLHQPRALEVDDLRAAVALQVVRDHGRHRRVPLPQRVRVLAARQEALQNIILEMI